MEFIFPQLAFVLDTAEAMGEKKRRKVYFDVEKELICDPYLPFIKNRCVNDELVEAALFLILSPKVNEQDGGVSLSSHHYLMEVETPLVYRRFYHEGIILY